MFRTRFYIESILNEYPSTVNWLAQRNLSDEEEEDDETEPVEVTEDMKKLAIAKYVFCA
jgi:hypothetical protein